jgi:hypothetical protein
MHTRKVASVHRVRSVHLCASLGRWHKYSKGSEEHIYFLFHVLLMEPIRILIRSIRGYLDVNFTPTGDKMMSNNA